MTEVILFNENYLFAVFYAFSAITACVTSNKRRLKMPIFTAKIPTQGWAGIPLCIEIYGDVFPSVNSLFCIYAICDARSITLSASAITLNNRWSSSADISTSRIMRHKSLFAKQAIASSTVFTQNTVEPSAVKNLVIL